MKLEAGKFYKMRNGAIAGPIYEDEGEWMCNHNVGNFEPMWHLETGVCLFFSFGPESDKPEFDLVEEA